MIEHPATRTILQPAMGHVFDDDRLGGSGLACALCGHSWDAQQSQPTPCERRVEPLQVTATILRDRARAAHEARAAVMPRISETELVAERRRERRREWARARRQRIAEQRLALRMARGQRETADERRERVARQRSEAVRLRAEGISVREIAGTLGLTYERVRQMLIEAQR